MIFRQATISELDDAMTIIEEGRAALKAQGLDQWQNGSPSKMMLEADSRAGQTYVAIDDDGNMLGTLAFVDSGEPDYANPIKGNWLIDLPATREAAQAQGDKVRFVALHRIAVSQKAARKGVATFMIQESAKLARERQLLSVRADTHEGNIPMQQTFEKCGMVHCCDIELSGPEELTKLRLGYETLV